MQRQKAKMRYSKTLSYFRVGLGVWRLACLVFLSAYLVRSSLGIIPVVSSFVYLPFVVAVAVVGCRLRCMVGSSYV